MDNFLLTTSLLLGIAIFGSADRFDNKTGELVSNLFMLAFPNNPGNKYNELLKDVNFDEAAIVCQLIAADAYNENTKCTANLASRKVTLDGTYSNYDVSSRDNMKLIRCLCSFRDQTIPFFIIRSKKFDFYYVFKKIPDSNYLMVECLYDNSNGKLFYNKVPESWGRRFY